MRQIQTLGATNLFVLRLLTLLVAMFAAAATTRAEQFVLVDVTFTYTKDDADNSKPSKSHFYVKGDLLNPDRPKDWTHPIDYRNGTVHIRLEVLEKPPGGAPTTWTLCYIPNKGQKNGYGCTGTGIYREKGVYERDVSMTSFWENDSIIWSEGIKQMDLVIKDDSGGGGHAHKRTDHEKFFPTKVRITMVQVSAGAKYDPNLVPNLPAKQREEDAKGAQIKKPTDGAVAALDVHEAARAMDKLPRFYYHALSGNGVVDTMRDMAECSLDGLKQAIDGLVVPQDRVEWKATLAWDEQRAVWSNAFKTFRQDRVWTKDLAFERGASQDRPTSYVFTQTPERLWNGCLREFAYFRVTPHRFWWASSTHRNDAISLVPLEQANYRLVATEAFDDEPCDVFESEARAERLWIGQESKRLRGALTFRNRGGTTQPSELIRFRDYREVAPGVQLPFREDRAFTHGAGPTWDRFKYIHLWVAVQEVSADFELTETAAKLQPKDGEQVQDQRFGVVVNYKFRPDRGEREILEMVDAERQKLAVGGAAMKNAIAPIEALVGKRAPPLPADGWIGDKRPAVAGQPYLLHFWATWCGPCKNDLPRLKTLASQGVCVIGMHPAGTSADEVAKATIEHELGYPTFLAVDDAAGKIGGYPAAIFPYCVLVDRDGHVAGHGSLGPELIARLRALQAEKEGSRSQ